MEWHLQESFSCVRSENWHISGIILKLIAAHNLQSGWTNDRLKNMFNIYFYEYLPQSSTVITFDHATTQSSDSLHL